MSKELHSTEENIEAFSASIEKAVGASHEEFLKWFDGGNNELEIRNSGYRDFFSAIVKDLVFEKTAKNSRQLTGLEIGCGGGRVTNAACKYFGHMVGLDIHESLSETDKFLQKENTNFSLKRIEQNKFPLDSNSIDFIYSIIVFQHILKFDCFLEYVSEMKRVMKQTGQAIIYFGRPKFFTKRIWKSKFTNYFFLALDKLLFEWIFLNIFAKGYKEYPNAPVNHVSLVVSRRKAKKIFEKNGFVIKEKGISYKRKGFGTQYYFIVELK